MHLVEGGFLLIWLKINHQKINFGKIAAIVGNTVEEVYGVTGLSSYRTILNEIQTLLKKENFRDGVKVIKVSDTNYEVTVFAC